MSTGVEDFAAFVAEPRRRIPPLASGTLDGLEFVVKDLIDVAGSITGAGNPDWAVRQHPAIRSASVVTRLLKEGATYTGKTITDELAFSLEGENSHYGTPINPRCPDRLPGGSSSGSAVAVAAGLADLALGTDTGGSIRVPASFCGVFGYRPSHGRVPMDGVVPFAPGFDTVGLFARDADVLQRGAHALLQSAPAPRESATLLLAADTLALMQEQCLPALETAARALHPSADVAVFAGEVAAFLEGYRVLQSDQIARALGPFLHTRPRFGPTIAPRFASVFDVTSQEVQRWAAWRKMQRARLHELLAPGRFLLLPAAPGIAPKRFLRDDAAEAFYIAALSLNAVAGLAGLPVVTVPVAQVEGCPLGLSIMAGPGEDESLLEFVARTFSASSTAHLPQSGGRQASAQSLGGEARQ